VAGLALLETPLHFGPNAGALAPVVAASPHAGWLEERVRVGGAFLDVVTAAAAPREFVLERYADFWTSVMRGRLRLHLQVIRWALDECALPGRFHRGELLVAGARVGPATLTTPLLNVVNPLGGAIPASAIVPFHEAAASSCKELIEYRGEHGTRYGTSACWSGKAHSPRSGRRSSSGRRSAEPGSGRTESRRRVRKFDLLRRCSHDTSRTSTIRRNFVSERCG
jgi:hypothetical protein